MPAVGTFLGTVLFTIGTTAVTVGSIVVPVALALASRLITSALTPKLKSGISVNSPFPFQMAVSQPRRFAYGRCAVGGDIVYWEVTGTNNEFLWLVVAIHDTPIHEIDAFIIENTVINFTANAATNVYISGASARMWRWDKLGLESQTVEGNLDAASTAWTSDHRLRGIAYYVLKLQHETAVYPVGMPQPITVLKGRKIWDPRLDNSYGGSGTHVLATESTWIWSANPALCLLDYLKGVNINGERIGGCGIPIAAIDHLSFSAAANVCDEDVSLLAGGTEDRYSCHGFVDALEDKEAVVEAMLLAMHGTLVLRGGKIYLIAGAAQTSVMALTDDDLAGDLIINPSVSRQDKVNKVTGVFADPNQNYAAVPCAPLIVAQYVTDDGGVTLEREVQHRFTTSSTTVDRLNKLVLSSFREQLSIQAVFKPKALEISAGDTFTWTSAAAGYSASNKMICLARNLLPDGSVEIVGRQETDAKYSWATSEELDPPTYGTGPSGAVPPAPGVPGSLAVTQSNNTITLTWTEVTGSPHLDGYDVYYGAVGGSIGTATLLSQGTRLTRYTTNASVVVPGPWKFYVRARDSFGQTGTAASVNFTVLSTANTRSSLASVIGTELGFTGVQLVLDAGHVDSYIGSGTTWADIAGTVDSFTLANMTFSGTAGGCTANEYFTSAGSGLISRARPAWVEAFHKNNAQLAIGVLVQANSGVGRILQLLGDYTVAGTLDTGFTFYIDEENGTINFKVFNNGASVLDVQTGLEFHHTDGRWVFFGISLNEATGANGGFFAIDGATYNFTSTYGSPSSSSAEAVLSIGSADNAMPSTDRIACLFALDNNISAAGWITIYNQFKSQRPEFGLP